MLAGWLQLKQVVIKMARSNDKDGEGTKLQDHWYLVDTHGQKFRLPKTMLFLGREECDVIVASQSVDKRHAVLTFDLYLNQFKVKDLSTTNGTYVNNSRIPEEEYITLNHMDSIRLGQDAMLYHIEQASQLHMHREPLPESHYIPPSASQNPASIGTHMHREPLPESHYIPPSASQNPASIRTHMHRERLPESHYIPPSASQNPASIRTHMHASALAECQGCMEDQTIEHTCCVKLEHKAGDSDIQMACIAHCKHLHNENNVHQHALPKANPTKVIPAGTIPSNSDHFNQKYHISLQTVIQEKINPDDNQEKPTEVKDQDSLADNTSDRFGDSAKIRPRPQEIRQVTHTESLFIPEVYEKAGKLVSEAHPGGAVQTMFVVTFDDSVCNTNISTPSVHQEKPASTSRNLQSSELGAVKQGTPLYGQPSWWGEGEGDAAASSSSTLEGESKGASGNVRPTDLDLRGNEAAVTLKPQSVSRSSNVESDLGKVYLNPIYMEIPIREHDSPKGADQSKDITTPAKSITSSLSRDSLSLSPELKQPNKTAKMYSNTSLEGNSSMSFTIDLDDPEHPATKSLNIGSSISEFVPSKIRKNFRERKATSSKTGSKESTPSKHSEERELSPLGQQKVDEGPSMPAENKGRPWLASVQATAGSSLRSPNLEEIDRFSDFSDERSSLERDSDRRSSVKRAVSSKCPQVASRAGSSPGMRSSSRSPAAAGHSLSMSHYSDPTCYLIDRMLEGGSADPLRADKQQSPEAKMYREAVIYDKTLASRQSTDKSLVRPVIHPMSYLPAVTKPVKKAALGQPAQLVTACDSDGDDDDDDLKIIEDIPHCDNEVDEKEDKVSEAGTYTIEADLKEGKEEEQEARQRIDQVFGVDLDSFSTDQPVIDPLRLASPGGYDNVYDMSSDGERTPLDENNLSPVEDDDTDLTVDDFSEENSDMATTDGVQMWVSQLAALTNQKSSEANRMAKEESDASLSKKPPQGISRKRPGTGRKLPTIPSDKSPVSSEHGSVSADLDNDVTLRRTPDRGASGRNSADSSYNIGTHSSKSHTRSIGNGHPASPSASARTGSVDTEVLLQDTETVMAAIQARFSLKSSHGRKNSYSRDCDNDASSTVALVNGEENYVKSAQYKSPREALAQIQRNGLSVKSGSTSSTTPVSSGKKPVIRSCVQAMASKSIVSSRSTPSSTGTRKSIVSDVVSRRDSMDNDSIISDVSSDAGDVFARSSTKGKGAITMTRTNKTFDLRRARVDSFEEPAGPRSAKSSASSKSGVSNSFGRSQSLHSTTRSRSLVNTSRSEATSLGAQIVKKSQSNAAQENLRKTGNTSIGRGDNSRQNQGKKLQHSSSAATASHPAVGNSHTRKESTPKSQSRLTPTNKGSLAITGISSVSSRSQSQPSSRSNSPKAAEKMAWKRRKEYDARKSVADAKACKPKEGVSTKSKASAKSDIKKRMIRSASFTNSAGLSLGIRNSVSGSQDFSDQMDSYNKHEDFRRAFIPFHSSLRNDRYTHSADEDDSLVSTNSTQDVAKSLVSLLDTPSAFTPPPQRHRPVSPHISPPSKAYLSLRRRTLNIEGSFLARELQTNGHTAERRQYTTNSRYQTSYDSLIVASIYQLSLKLKTSTDKTLSMLREQNRVSLTPSPIDDFLSDSSKSEITAWKTANQELASTLKNLRKLERHVRLMNAVIFPDTDVNNELWSHVSTSRQVKQKLLKDIEKKFGFQPIDHPDLEESDFASPEMAEFSGQF